MLTILNLPFRKLIRLIFVDLCLSASEIAIKPYRMCDPVFVPTRTKCSGWCMCGLCAEIRRSSTRTRPGDYLTYLRQAPSRSSKTLLHNQSIHSQGANVTAPEQALEFSGKTERRARRAEMRESTSGQWSRFTTEILWSRVVFHSLF